MDDIDIAYLEKCLGDGLLVLAKVDFAIPEPGSLNKWRTGHKAVVRIGPHDGEPVAWLEDGTCVALWACDRDEFTIAVNKGWPPA